MGETYLAWNDLARLADRLESRAQTPFNLPRLWLVTDEIRLSDPLTVAQNLPANVGVLFRHYGHAGREEIAAELSRTCDHFLAIAGDPHLAYRLGADACHFPEHQVHDIPFCRQRYPNLRVTTAVHSLGAALKAKNLGADAGFLSPIFSTQSHPGSSSLGVIKSAALARMTDLPLIALGGINEATAGHLTGTQIQGFAAITEFL